MKRPSTPSVLHRTPIESLEERIRSFSSCSHQADTSLAAGRRVKPRMWVPSPRPVSDEELISDSSDEDDSDDSYNNLYKRQRTQLCPSSSSHSRRRVVRFAPKPIIHEIPSRKSYSPRDKEQIWNSRSTLKQMTRRNRREWAWEMCHGGGVVVEEEDFQLDEQGNLVHPAHITHHQQQQHQQSSSSIMGLYSCI